MDKNKSTVKLYYKNLAKAQRKRWRKRKSQKEAEKKQYNNEQKQEPQLDLTTVQPKLIPKEIDVSGLVKTGKSIGAGTFGHCSLARYRGMIVVVKEYKQNNLEPSQVKQEVLNEARVLMELGDQRNVPLLFGISTTSLPYKMVLQFHGINNRSLTIAKAVKASLKENDWVSIVRGAASGLCHVHSRGFIHNDIKSNNVVVDYIEEKYNAVLIDFGKATKISTTFKKKKLSLEEQLSYSQRYPHIAPEIVDGSGGPSIKSDVYSFGKLLQFIEEHSSFKVKNPLNSLCYKAALLKNPNMRPSMEQVVYNN